LSYTRPGKVVLKMKSTTSSFGQLQSNFLEVLLLVKLNHFQTNVAIINVREAIHKWSKFKKMQIQLKRYCVWKLTYFIWVVRNVRWNSLLLTYVLLYNFYSRQTSKLALQSYFTFRSVFVLAFWLNQQIVWYNLLQQFLPFIIFTIFAI